MPHLSPMLWCETMIALWLLTSMIYIYQWWTTTLSFKVKLTQEKSKKSNIWSW